MQQHPTTCRNLEHSTILYEDPKQLPLLRLSWNKQDPNYLATVAMESTEVKCAMCTPKPYVPFPSHSLLLLSPLSSLSPSLPLPPSLPTPPPFLSLPPCTGHHTGCPCTQCSSLETVQPQSLRQWHRMGPTLIMSHMYCR